MNIASPLLCVMLVAATVGWSPAAQPSDDPLHAHLYSPELLIRHRENIGLDDEQVEKIRAIMQEAGPKVQAHQRKLAAAKEKLTKLLAADKVDEDATVTQLGTVLAAEKEVRLMHLRAMIQLRNLLSSDQQKVAARMQRNMRSARGPGDRVQDKVSRIEKEKPDDPKSSRFKPAKRKPLSIDKVKAEVAALKKEDVAWRKIEWKTCLIDGLTASRKQKKPVMLWVFIDRPIDDERC